MEPEQNERSEGRVGEEVGEVGRTREQRAIVGIVLLLPIICYAPVRGLDIPIYCPASCSAIQWGLYTQPHLCGPVGCKQKRCMPL